MSPTCHTCMTHERGLCPGGYLPQVWVPTVNRTQKAVAVKAETEERWPPHTLKFWSDGTSLKGHALTLWPLKQDMKSLLQAKYRQTLIIKCFRYNLYITGSHFGERQLIDGKSEAVKIPKLGSGKSHSRYPNPKSQYPPPPRGLWYDTVIVDPTCVVPAVYNTQESWSTWVRHYVGPTEGLAEGYETTRLFPGTTTVARPAKEEWFRGQLICHAQNLKVHRVPWTF